jgi:hypothetical protein
MVGLGGNGDGVSDLNSYVCVLIEGMSRDLTTARHAPAHQASPQMTMHTLNRVMIRARQCTTLEMQTAPSTLNASPALLLTHPPSAEDVSVSKVLRGKVANGVAGQHNLGAAVSTLGQLVIDDVPLCKRAGRYG